MKRKIAAIALTAVLALSATGTAYAQSAVPSEQTPVLDRAKAIELAADVLQGLSCEAYKSLQGLDMTQAEKAAEEIAHAGQGLLPGSMGVVSLSGDDGQKSVTLMVIQGSKNIAAYHTMFSNAHPKVDETNSWCFNQR